MKVWADEIYGLRLVEKQYKTGEVNKNLAKQ